MVGLGKFSLSSNSNDSKGETLDNKESKDVNAVAPIDTDSESVNAGELVVLDKGDRRIGLISAAFLITNRILGTGIFSVTSTILTLSGSVGVTLILWVVGMIIALAGLYVYAEFGSYPSRLLQRNGGEKNYLEYVYKNPKFLVTCMYAMYVVLLGWASGNSVVFGEYILNAANVEPTEWAARGIGIACVSFAFLINTLNVKAGLFVMNTLGFFKVAIVLLISVTGWVALGGGINNSEFEPTGAFSNAFDGDSPSGYGIVMSLYNVIWAFVGYSNVNYSLSEVRNPVKALKISAPIAVISLGVIYMFVNIAYFAVVPGDVIRSSGRIIAAHFFRIAFGETAERACSVFVALSALGNVISVIFSQGRIVQQLGREGVLPFSSFFASQRPFNSPFTGLFEHWVICVITIVAPPAGDAYNFVMNLISYPLNIINFFVAIGLLWLHYEARKGRREWTPVIKSPIVVTFFFALASLYLVVAPYIPPTGGQNVYNDMPYWIHCVAAWGVFFAGGVYWVIWAKILPRYGKYKLVSRDVLEDDGFWRNKFFKIPYGSELSEEEFIEEHQKNL
ncbi:High affinity methionine permease [Komagataella phaffii CBS 7435]|uniref:High affinity methionine permease n=2 Tax=Komagataella phaffii TaxID=460519 RepID=C4R0E7_KOMPG|nr:High affinity methionine permease [Komagataella phaffii GS115]AOA62715.1 GQ67_00389T0 [Komagataella phaffii]CAH2448513.1 High affinity methionine permease [Komagataella phaffii CBS 7435]AOA68126.1 GQ68_01000T0 [Komagataella phaffii GS115]CAY68971.1 High affinity methionine permease [Komagataella phaffii GS115]CCA38629.1 High affinity methionine permease [Komagataella phaffii CBS 7435]